MSSEVYCEAITELNNTIIGVIEHDVDRIGSDALSRGLISGSTNKTCGGNTQKATEILSAVKAKIVATPTTSPTTSPTTFSKFIAVLQGDGYSQDIAKELTKKVKELTQQKRVEQDRSPSPAPKRRRLDRKCRVSLRRNLEPSYTGNSSSYNTRDHADSTTTTSGEPISELIEDIRTAVDRVEDQIISDQQQNEEAQHNKINKLDTQVTEFQQDIKEKDEAISEITEDKKRLKKRLNEKTEEQDQMRLQLQRDQKRQGELREVIEGKDTTIQEKGVIIKDQADAISELDRKNKELEMKLQNRCAII